MHQHLVSGRCRNQSAVRLTAVVEELPRAGGDVVVVFKPLGKCDPVLAHRVTKVCAERRTSPRAQASQQAGVRNEGGWCGTGADGPDVRGVGAAAGQEHGAARGAKRLLYIHAAEHKALPAAAAGEPPMGAGGGPGVGHGGWEGVEWGG